jgi:hypothetical protein
VAIAGTARRSGWWLRSAAVAAVLAGTLSSCLSDPSPGQSAAPSPTPSVPMPTTTAELLARLTDLADRLDRPGDGIADQQARAEACIELDRLRNHASSYPRPMLNDKLFLQLNLGADQCPTHPERAVNRLRFVVANAPSSPPPSPLN